MWLDFNMFEIILARAFKERLPKMLKYPCLVLWPMVYHWPKLEFIFSVGVKKRLERYTKPSLLLVVVGCPITYPILLLNPSACRCIRPALCCLHCSLISVSVSSNLPVTIAGVPDREDYKSHLFQVSKFILCICRKGDTHLKEPTDEQILRVTIYK